MKVIGFTSDGAIVEMSGTELARLMGHESVYELGKDERRGGWDYKLRDKVALNSEYQINEMWDWMRKARDAYDKIKASSGLLRGAADILDKAPPPALQEEQK